MLHALTSIWLRAVLRDVPAIRCAPFLDDRTLWATGKLSAKHVVGAMLAGQRYDSILGFQLHPDKLASLSR